MSDNTSSEVISQDVSPATVMLEQRASETGAKLAPTAYGISRMSDGGCLAPGDSASDALEKWFHVTTEKWEATSKTLFELDLPGAAISKTLFSPLAMMFKNHKYWRGDIVVRIQLNSNKFMVGKILTSFYYGQKFDAGFDNSRNNLAGRSQMLNVTLSAASNNVAELRIPYGYPKPFMSTRPNSIGEIALYMGTLHGTVLNKLQTTSTVSNYCSLSVWIKFENNLFTGLLSSNLNPIPKPTAHQVWDEVKEAVHVIDAILNGPSNRDQPTSTVSPNCFIPRSSSSFATGKNDTQALSTFHLDAHAVTPCMGNPNSLKVKDLVRNWGLLTQIPLLEASNVAGKRCFTIPVCPFRPKSRLSALDDKTPADGTLPRYTSTPLEVVSSMFGMWRGSIEFRFDFIASQYHTARFMIAYVPDDSAEAIGFDNAKCSYNVVFDLEEDNSVIFVTPFISDAPWWPIVGSDTMFKTEFQFPGYLCFYILNPLVVMDNVPKTIDINIYIRGGEDFELAVPGGPLYGLSWDLDTLIVPQDSVSFASGYSNVYVGTWRNFYGGTKCILRYGSVSDQVAQLVNANYDVIYAIDSTSKTDHPLTFRAMAFYESSGKKVPYDKEAIMTHIVVPRIPNDTPRYAIPFFSLADARSFLAKGNDWAYDYKVSSPQVDLSAARFTPVFSAEPQVRTLNPGTLVVQDYSQFTFGESFDDLKDLLRRFQLYMRDTIAIVPNMDTGLVCFRFPVIPSGLPLRLNNGSDLVGTFNAYRQGHIPLILSAFRFFRGSIRLKIVFVCDLDVIALVQFIPNVFIKDPKNFSPDPSQALSHYGLTYPTVIQASSVNKIVELEVPFYMNSNMGMLQRPRNITKENPIKDIDRYYSLGSIAVSFLNTFPTSQKIEMNVYYSVGDDFDVYLYQGFPAITHIQDVPMFDRAEIPPKNISILPSEFPIPRFSSDPEIFRECLDEPSEASHQILVTTPLVYMGARATCEATTNLVRGISVAAKLGRAYHQTDTAEVTKNLMSMIDEQFGDLIPATKQAIFSAVSQLVHSLINPTVATVAWSLTSFFVSIGFLTYDSVGYVVAFFEKMLGFARPASGTEQMDIGSGETAEHQALCDEFTEKEKVAFISVCVAGISTALGMAITIPSKDRSLVAYVSWMLKGFSSFVFSVKVILEILTKTMGLFSRICNYFLGSQTPDFFWKQELMMHRSEMVEWAESVNAFCDPGYYPTIERDIALQKEVFDLALVGNLYVAKSINTTETDPALPAIRMLSTKINKLQTRLVEKHMVPAAKFEPFVFQLFGPTNIGKSTLQFSIGADMLKKIGYRGYGEFMYTRTPGNKHLNTLSDQKIFVFDDFLQVRGGDLEQENISELFCLKSRGIYNPPMAELSDKRIRYSPLIVMLSSNQAFWQLNSLSDVKALYRRRDTLWYAEKKSAYKDVLVRDIDEEVRNSFGYLYFIKVDPMNDSFNPADYTEESPEAMDYSKFAEALCTEWFEYYLVEMQNYKRFLGVLYQLYPGDHSMTADDLKKVQKDHAEKLLDDYCANERRDFINYRECMVKHVLPFSDPPPTPGTHQTETSLLETVMLPTDMDVYNKITSGQLKLLTDDFLDFLQGFDNFTPDAKGFELRSLRDTILQDISRLDYYGQLEQLTDDLPRLFHFLYLYNSPLNQFFGHMHPRAYYEEKGCFCLRISNDYTYDSHSFKLILGKGIIIQAKCPATECIRDCDPRVRFFVEDVMARIIYNTTQHSAVQVAALDKTLYPEFYYRYIYALLPIPPGVLGDRPSKYNALIRECLSADTPDYSASAFINWFVEKFKSLKIPSTLYNILKLLGLFVAGSTLYKLIYRFYGGASSESAQSGAEAGHESREFIRHGKQTKSSSSYKKVYNFAPPQSDSYSVDHQTVNTNRFCSLLNALQSNAFVLSAKCGVHAQTGKGLGISGNVAIILKHHYEGIRRFLSTGQEVVITITRSGAVSSIEFEECDFRTDPESSICFVRFPRRLPFFKKITQYFPKVDEMSSIPSQGVLVDTNGRHLIQNNVDFTRYDDLSISESSWASAQRLCVAFRYFYAGDGLCGSSLLSLGSNPRIVGIHVAGNGTTVGYSQPVYQELLVASGLLQDDTPETIDHECFCYTEPRYDPSANVIIRGSVYPKYIRRYPKRSKIIPSPLHDLFPARTTPAPLSGDDPRLSSERDLLSEAICKRNKVPHSFSRDTILRATEIVSEIINGAVRPLVANRESLLTMEEAVCGIEGITEYNGVDMRTSEGFPWTAWRPKGAKNKSWLFSIALDGSFPRLVGLHPRLSEEVGRNEHLRNNGIIPPTIFCDSLKDARIDPIKIHKMAPTRLFSMSPVDFTLCVKRLFGHFQASLIRSRIFSGTAIGINPDGPDWFELYRYLTEVGDLSFEGDYRAFGDTLDPEFVFSAIDIINGWYRLHFGESPNSPPQISREIIGKEVSHALYLVHDCVYQALCGIPSGCPITVELNSIVGLLYIAYAYLETVPKALRSGRVFLQSIRPITYGDDFVVALSSAISKYFDGELFRLCMSNHGITVTNSNKTDDPIQLVPILRASFLKRGFRQHPHRSLSRLAPIDIASIEECVLWQWDSAIEPIFQSMATCRSALELMYSRGPDDYTKFRKILIDTWALRGHIFHALTWDEIDFRIYDPGNSYLPFFQPDNLNYNFRCDLYANEDWAPTT